jgi:hypothetical protein
MKKENLIILALLFQLSVSSCSLLMRQPSSDSAIPRKTTGEPNFIPTLSSAPSIEITPSNSIAYVAGEITCNTLLETNWGKNTDEFGYNPPGVSWFVGMQGPYPLIFDKTGSFYVPDQVNNRILAYKNNKAPKVINLPDSYILKGMGDGSYYTGWRWPVISGDKIYLLYSHLYNDVHLSTVSLQGKITSDLSLRQYSKSGEKTGIDYRLISDGIGGVYIIFDEIPFQIYHFDAETGFTPTSFENKDQMRLGRMQLGWDNHLYTYERAVDSLIDWGQGGTAKFQPIVELENIEQSALVYLNKKGVGQIFSLIGVDNNKNAYFTFLDTDKQYYIIQVSFSKKIAKIATVAEQAFPTLSPTNEFYNLSYNYQSSAQLPKIIKCGFAVR